MKIYGQAERMQLENLSVDPSGAGLVKGRTWFNTSSGQAKYYDGSAVQVFGSLAASADTIAAAMTSNGTTSIASTMTTANANTIGAKITTAADTIAGQMTVTGANAIGSKITVPIASTKTADYIITTSDTIGTVLADATSGVITITLPAASSSSGRILRVKKTDSAANFVTVSRAGSDLIEGIATFLLVDMDDWCSLLCDGSGWVIIGKGMSNRVLTRIRDEGASGHGSTNTKIRRIETSVLNTGNAVTRAISATLGNSYTINQTGVYQITYSDRNSASSLLIGLSNTSAQLTTGINLITNTTRLAYVASTAAIGGSVSTTRLFSSGTIIRPHTDGNPDTNGVDCCFEINKISL